MLQSDKVSNAQARIEYLLMQHIFLEAASLH